MLNMKKLLSKLLACDLCVASGVIDGWIYQKFESGRVIATKSILLTYAINSASGSVYTSVGQIVNYASLGLNGVDFVDITISGDAITWTNLVSASVAELQFTTISQLSRGSSSRTHRVTIIGHTN